MFVTFLASLGLAFHAHTAAHNHTACNRTYTVGMGIRAIDATFDRGLPTNRRQRAHLRRYIHCQRDTAHRRFLVRLWAAKARRRPMNGPGIASWYYDGGSTGCGFHATYGVATLIAPCGSRLRICNGSDCIVATRDDSGPYVGGRTFDLNPSTRAALGCTGLCAVTWRRLS